MKEFKLGEMVILIKTAKDEYFIFNFVNDDKQLLYFNIEADLIQRTLLDKILDNAPIRIVSDKELTSIIQDLILNNDKLEWKLMYNDFLLTRMVMVNEIDKLTLLNVIQIIISKFMYTVDEYKKAIEEDVEESVLVDIVYNIYPLYLIVNTLITNDIIETLPEVKEVCEALRPIMEKVE